MGRSYRYKLEVTNGAGLQRVLESTEFELTHRGSKLSFFWHLCADVTPLSVCSFVEKLRYVVIAAAVFVFGAITTAALVYFTSKIRKRTQFNADEHLKAFMYHVMDSSEEDVSTSSVPINDQQELAFVITGYF